MKKSLIFFTLFFASVIMMACAHASAPLNTWNGGYTGQVTFTEKRVGDYCNDCLRRYEFTSYIVGVNWETNRFIESSLRDSHTEKGKSIKVPDGDTYIKSNMTTGLPLTLFFSIHAFNEYEDSGLSNYVGKDIIASKLYYKVIPYGKTYNDTGCKWRLCKSVSFNAGNGAKYSKDSEKGDLLFGSECLTKEMIEANGDTISAGDTIYVVWYFMDEDSNENIEEIEIGKAEPYLDLEWFGCGSDKLDRNDGYDVLAAQCIVLEYDGTVVYGR